MDDIVNLIIYLAIGILGLLASAYRNKQKRKAQSSRIPRDFDPRPLPDVQPDLGPLAEILGIPVTAIPKPVEAEVIKETIPEDEGFLVEEDGYLVETTDRDAEQPVITAEQEGLTTEKVDYEGMPVFKSTEGIVISNSITDSAITDMESIYESIHSSEIKAEDEISKSAEIESINWRKAVIYSEILQRRGN
jgi:hypothetical protein